MKNLKFILLLLVTAILFVADIAYGSVRIPISELFSNNELYHNIIYNFRLPKALTALITGAAISVAGLIMQTLFRNPLAGPYVLGVSSGASLGVATFILAGGILPAAFIERGWGLVISATLGAILVLMMVLAVSVRVRQAVSLLIVGIMFGQLSGSLVTILQNSSDPDSLKLFVVWTFGSLSAVTWNYMWVMLPIVVVGLAIVFAIQFLPGSVGGGRDNRLSRAPFDLGNVEMEQGQLSAFLLVSGLAHQGGNFRQGKDLFHQKKKGPFAHAAHLRGDTLHRSATGDKSVVSLLPFALGVVADAVLIPLASVLVLLQLSGGLSILFL